MEKHTGGSGISGTSKYIDLIKDDFNSAIKDWRKRYVELSDKEWVEANEVVMRYAGKRKWEREPQIYERELIRLVNRNISKDSRILDAGCGIGYILYSLYNLGYKSLYGIDLSKICINEFAKRCSLYKISVIYTQMDIKDNEFTDNTFDCVICTEVLEHCKSPVRIINEIYRIVKPGGSIFIATPHMDRRTAYTHINFFHCGNYNSGDIKGYNVYNIMDVLNESSLSEFKVSLDKRNKFLIISGVK